MKDLLQSYLEENIKVNPPLNDFFYYDKFLKQCKENTIKIGLSIFEPVSLIKNISPLDVKLDYGVTADSIFSF